MAGTLITPTTSVSPAGGGSIAMTATTPGTFDDGDWRGAYQLYRYIATPAAGSRFVRFDCRGVYKDNLTVTGNSWEETWRGDGVYSPQDRAYVYEPPHIEDYIYKAPFWAEFYNTILDPWTTEMVTLEVTAVFEAIPRTGLLIRNAAGTGLLRGDTVSRPLVDA